MINNSKSNNRNNDNSDDAEDVDYVNDVFGMQFDEERKRLVVCDCNNKRLCVWSEEGEQAIQFMRLKDGQMPISVCFDSFRDNNYYAVGTGDQQILVFDSRKDKMGNYANALQVIGGKARFSGRIHGVCVNDVGELMASDDENHVIQIFK